MEDQTFNSISQTFEQGSKAAKGESKAPFIIAMIATAAILLGAVGAFALNLPVQAGSSYSASSGAADAMSSFELNSATSENVYQQQVVAGWAAKDLLKVVADQTNYLVNFAEKQTSAQGTLVILQLLTIALLALLLLVAGRIALLLINKSKN